MEREKGKREDPSWRMKCSLALPTSMPAASVEKSSYMFYGSNSTDSMKEFILAAPALILILTPRGITLNIVSLHLGCAALFVPVPSAIADP